MKTACLFQKPQDLVSILRNNWLSLFFNKTLCVFLAGRWPNGPAANTPSLTKWICFWLSRGIIFVVSDQLFPLLQLCLSCYCAPPTVTVHHSLLLHIVYSGCILPRLATRFLVVALVTFMMTQQRTHIIFVVSDQLFLLLQLCLSCYCAPPVTVQHSLLLHVVYLGCTLPKRATRFLVVALMTFMMNQQRTRIIFVVSDQLFLLLQLCLSCYCVRPTVTVHHSLVLHVVYSGCTLPRLATRFLVVALMTFMMTQQRTRIIFVVSGQLFLLLQLCLSCYYAPPTVTVQHSLLLHVVYLGCTLPKRATRFLVVALMTFMMTQQRTRTICNPKLIAIFARLEKI